MWEARGFGEGIGVVGVGWQGWMLVGGAGCRDRMVIHLDFNFIISLIFVKRELDEHLLGGHLQTISKSIRGGGRVNWFWIMILLFSVFRYFVIGRLLKGLSQMFSCNNRILNIRSLQPSLQQFHFVALLPNPLKIFSNLKSY